MSSLNQNAPFQHGTDGFALLPEDILGKVMDLVGPGHYRYVAGTCKKFRHAYETQHLSDTSTRTSLENIVRSEAISELYVAERVVADVSRSSRYRIAKLAARHGRLVVLKWSEAPRVFADCETYIFHENLDGIRREAAKNGHIKCFEYLSDSEHEIHYRFLRTAVANGQLAFLRHLFEKGVRLDASPSVSTNLCDDAATSGHLHVLKFLHEEANIKLPSDICNRTARAGHVECLDYVRGKGARFDTYVLEDAAGSGQIDCVRYVFEILNEKYSWGDYFPKGTLSAAAGGGNRDCLEFLSQFQHVWDESDVTQALLHSMRTDKPDALSYLLNSFIKPERKEHFLNLALKRATLYCSFDCLGYLVGIDNWKWSSLVVHRVLEASVDSSRSWMRIERCFRRLLQVDVEWDRDRLVRSVDRAEQRGKPRCASCLRDFLNDLQQQQH